MVEFIEIYITVALFLVGVCAVAPGGLGNADDVLGAGGGGLLGERPQQALLPHHVGLAKVQVWPWYVGSNN